MLFDPVAPTKDGGMVEGKPEFAVGYLGKVYLCSSEVNAQLFMQNPARYLKSKPVSPKSACLAVIGVRFVGKTAVANLLADQYKYVVITPDGE